ncbi:uncharacterized protein LOC111629619 [Centruroides sculpturatus]|uniref:uncharacterized protein LOC111629619 n=1 Tax=Centruroides sculpturatus TaxID=218467 RepID=UPI000C6DF2B2|nr:uncharacterized protein LOC111629619 [Centruroides sculpturatus]
MDTDRGCPQGLRRGPGLWNLVFDDLLNSIPPNHNCTLQAFADDLLLMISHHNVDRLEEINKYLKHIYKWSQTNKLPINYDKTVGMVCTRKNKRNRLQRPPRIFIGGNKIKIKQDIKYLGIHFDDKLNWHTHVRNICQHMDKKANLLNWITAKTWGNNYINSKIIYKAAVEPALLYAVQVWNEALNNVHMRRKLTSIQRKFTIKINKAYNTAPTNSLQVMANIPPIHLQAKQITWLLYLTSKNPQTIQQPFDKNEISLDFIVNTSSINKNKENYGINRKLKKDKYSCHPADEPNYTTHWDNEDNRNFKAKWSIYTDSSKNNNDTGAGFTIKNSNNRTTYQCYHKLASHCSNAQAKMWAIFKALEHINNNLDTYKGNIYIFTDSKMALHSLSNNNHPTVLTNNVQNMAKTLGATRNLNIAWVPAHTGIDGNEMADKLAKLGANSSTQPSFTDLPQKKLKKEIKIIINQAWQNNWETANTGRNCFSFIPSIDIRIAARHFVPNKLITQVLLGHGNFPAYLHRFGFKNSNKCSCTANSINDAMHFTFNCPIYDNYRAELQHKYLLENFSWPPNPTIIFQNKGLWKIFKNFIIKTGALKEHTETDNPEKEDPTEVHLPNVDNNHHTTEDEDSEYDTD